MSRCLSFRNTENSDFFSWKVTLKTEGGPTGLKRPLSSVYVKWAIDKVGLRILGDVSCHWRGRAGREASPWTGRSTPSCQMSQCMLLLGRVRVMSTCCLWLTVKPIWQRPTWGGEMSTTVTRRSHLNLADMCSETKPCCCYMTEDDLTDRCLRGLRVTSEEAARLKTV